MRRTVTALIVLTSCAAAAAAEVSPSDETRAAIVAAVRARLGGHADVRVENLQVRGEPDGPIVAVPSPGARTGTRIHFVLHASDATSRRIGDAEAVVLVAMPHLRSVRAVRRGAPIGADEVADQDGEVGSVLLQPLPTSAALAGARAARDIGPGEILTPALLTSTPLVKSGDAVLVQSSSAGVQVQATLVAAQAGGLGDIIRCVNPETRKAIAARVIGRGVAEVVHGF